RSLAPQVARPGRTREPDAVGLELGLLEPGVDVPVAVACDGCDADLGAAGLERPGERHQELELAGEASPPQLRLARGAGRARIEAHGAVTARRVDLVEG